MLKSRNSNKAFTLIELLGVIILLSVIAIIAIVAVNKNIKDTENTLKQVQLNNIKDGAKNWSTDNIKSIPDGETIYLTLAQLKQGGYVEENIKSPGNDKLCFPNDLQIQIISNDTGSYQYNILDNNITYISCEEDNLDSNAPRIVLSPGAEINDKNEVVDYVEVSQDAEGKYIVPRAFAYGSNGSNFNSTDYVFIATVNDDNDNSYTPDNDSNSISNIVLNDIKTVGQRYKITYSITYGNNKVVSAVRNIIIRDTTAPEITITNDEDYALYYYDTNNNLKFISYAFTSNNFEVTDNSGSVEKVNVEGEKEINSYFSSISDISNYTPKEFPIIISATDSSGNSAKKSQNLKLNIRQATGPILKLYNSSENEIYYEHNSDDSNLNKAYSKNWIDDKKLFLKVESGCPIDKEKSYYKYGETTKLFSELNINSLYDISILIDTTEEGQKKFEAYAKCSEEGLDRNIFHNIEVSMPEITLKIDHEVPVCDINITGGATATVNGVVWYKAKPTVKYTLSDTNGVSGTFKNNNTTTNITSAVKDVSVTVSDGTYTYTLSGTDVAGKTCTNTKTIRVDTNGPTPSNVASPTTAYVENSYTFYFEIHAGGVNDGQYYRQNSTDYACTSKYSSVTPLKSRLLNILISNNSTRISVSANGNTSVTASEYNWKTDNTGRNTTSTLTADQVFNKDYELFYGSTNSGGVIKITIPFKTIQTFNTITIVPKYTGNNDISCADNYFNNFKLNNNCLYISGNKATTRTSSGKKYVEKLSCVTDNNLYNSCSSIVWGCHNPSYNGKGYTGRGNNIVAQNISAPSTVTFTINFSDTLSGGVQTSSNGINYSTGTSGSCSANNGSSCDITARDSVGNTTKVRCTNGSSSRTCRVVN